ncbi:MAG: pyruvate formate lyase family protein [Oscillospiraceae bacterium]
MERFKGKIWQEEINTRDFIQNNYTPYDGDESFLAGPADSTNKLWGKVQQLQKEERAKGGVLDMDTHIVSGITSHEPGYIDPEMKDLEKIVGLQTDKPSEHSCPTAASRWLKRLATYGYTPSELHKIFGNITRLTTRAYSTLTLPRCAL